MIDILWTQVPSQSPRGGLNILIADDNAYGAATFAALLGRARHDVRVVADGPAAVAASLIDPPDAVLLDGGLPGLDGWQVARRIRADLKCRSCLMVAVAGYGCGDGVPPRAGLWPASPVANGLSARPRLVSSLALHPRDDGVTVPG
jgi:hypothetical protein